jgi:hypothetical protein
LELPWQFQPLSAGLPASLFPAVMRSTSGGELPYLEDNPSRCCHPKRSLWDLAKRPPFMYQHFPFAASGVLEWLFLVPFAFKVTLVSLWSKQDQQYLEPSERCSGSQTAI